MLTILEQLQRAIDLTSKYSANQPTSPEVTAKYTAELNHIFLTIAREISTECENTRELRWLLEQSKELLAESRSNSQLLTFTAANYKIESLALEQKAKKLSSKLQAKNNEIDELISEAAKSEEEKQDLVILNHLNEKKIEGLQLELDKKQEENRELRMLLAQKSPTPAFDSLVRTNPDNFDPEQIQHVASPPHSPKSNAKKMRRS